MLRRATLGIERCGSVFAVTPGAAESARPFVSPGLEVIAVLVKGVFVGV